MIGGGGGVPLRSGDPMAYRGLLFLQTNWWVSDEQFGFCHIDVNPVTGATSLSHCFQADATFYPGQTAAADPNGAGQQVVYVPDASGFTSNIYRFLFTPDATGGTITPTGILNGLGSKKGAKIETVALPLVQTMTERFTSATPTQDRLRKSPTRQPRPARPLVWENFSIAPA